MFLLSRAAFVPFGLCLPAGSGYRVVTAASPRMAPCEPPERQPQPLQRPVFTQCFEGILRAGRREAARRRRERGDAELVELHQRDQRQGADAFKRCSTTVSRIRRTAFLNGFIGQHLFRGVDQRPVEVRRAAVLQRLFLQPVCLLGTAPQQEVAFVGPLVEFLGHGEQYLDRRYPSASANQTYRNGKMNPLSPLSRTCGARHRANGAVPCRGGNEQSGMAILFAGFGSAARAAFLASLCCWLRMNSSFSVSVTNSTGSISSPL